LLSDIIVYWSQYALFMILVSPSREKSARNTG